MDKFIRKKVDIDKGSDLKNIYPAMDFLIASNKKGLGDNVEEFDKMSNAFSRVLSESSYEDRILIYGSFYTVSEFFEYSQSLQKVFNE